VTHHTGLTCARRSGTYAICRELSLISSIVDAEGRRLAHHVPDPHMARGAVARTERDMVVVQPIPRSVDGWGLECVHDPAVLNDVRTPHIWFGAPRARLP